MLRAAAGLVLAAGVGTWLGRRALRPLAAALALQRRFVADAGHELRTPVTLLHTRAQLARRRLRAAAPDGGGGELAADLDGVVVDAARLGAILEDLLLAADPTGDRVREDVDLVAVAADVVAAGVATAVARGVHLSGPAGAAPVVVAGSPVALRRAVTALVDNAVRHAASAVTVSARRRGAHADLEVIDDGPGVAADAAPHMFERFARGRTEPETGPRRYGIGLALVNEIATAHGGTVVLLPDRATGAALRMRLPARDAAPQDPRPAGVPRNL